MLKNFKIIYDREVYRFCRENISDLEKLILDSVFVRGFVFEVCKGIYQSNVEAEKLTVCPTCRRNNILHRCHDCGQYIDNPVDAGPAIEANGLKNQICERCGYPEDTHPRTTCWGKEPDAT